MRKRQGWFELLYRSAAMLVVLTVLALAWSGATTPGMVHAEEPAATPIRSAISADDIDRLEITAIEELDRDPYAWRIPSPDGTKALVGGSYREYALADRLPVRTFDLWVLDEASGEKEQIAETVTDCSWSPDGKSVAYVSPVASRGIAGELYVVDLVDKTPHRLAAVDIVQGFRYAEWLATDEIVYVYEGYPWVVQADGSNPHQLNGLHLQHIRPKESEELAAYGGNVVSFDISPDSKHIAYTRVVANPESIDPTRAYRDDVWVAALDGQNAVLVDESAATLRDGWSPNGELLAYAPLPLPEERAFDVDLAVFDVVTRERHAIFEAPNQYTTGGRPAWTTDSSMLAYQEAVWGEHKKFVLWISSADGSKQKSFADLDAFQYPTVTLTWAPDARSLSIRTPSKRYRLELGVSS